MRFIVKEKFDLFGKAPNRDSKCRVKYKASSSLRAGWGLRWSFKDLLAWPGFKAPVLQTGRATLTFCLFVCLYFLSIVGRQVPLVQSHKTHKPHLAFERCSQLVHMYTTHNALSGLIMLTQPWPGFLLCYRGLLTATAKRCFDRATSS